MVVLQAQGISHMSVQILCNFSHTAVHSIKPEILHSLTMLEYLVVGNHYNEKIIWNHLVSDTESQGHMSSQFCAWTQPALTSLPYFHHIQAGQFQPCLMS